MTESQISSNINYQRAKLLLDKQIDSPEYLIKFWRVIGSYPKRYPAIERVRPWYRGIEDLITD